MNFINIAYAQTAGNTNTVDGLAAWIANFVNNTLVYIIFALAFAFFLFGIFKYFFGSGAKAEENRKEGRQFIMWGIIAFVVMICVWGIVNLFVNTFGFTNKNRPDLPCFEGNNCNRAPGASGQVQTIPSPSANTPPSGYVGPPI
jgi:heme/copper-type cytochrome/quinol oxidase subunit 2